MPDVTRVVVHETWITEPISLDLKSPPGSYVTIRPATDDDFRSLRIIIRTAADQLVVIAGVGRFIDH